MKFYIKYKSSKIRSDKLTCIYTEYNAIWIFKNGKGHNYKNAAYIDGIYKQFFLNGKCYGTQNDFTKQSWRRFVKLQLFK